jgi:hypothetical protein
MTTMPSYAQLSDSLKNELQKVSLNMYASKDRNFVIVDAIIDGFIQPNTRYNFSFKNGIVKIDNMQLYDVKNMVYANKIQNFFSRQHLGANNNSFSMTNNVPLTLNDIFNPSSRFRTENKPLNPEIESKYRHIVNIFAADKLIDTSKYYVIKYDSKGLFINGKQIDDLTALKYIGLIHDEFRNMQSSNVFFIDKSHLLPPSY